MLLQHRHPDLLAGAGAAEAPEGRRLEAVLLIEEKKVHPEKKYILFCGLGGW